MKKILIAIPTARYIEADTFKSIYDLEIPTGYETTFQTFYGYRVDQVRNLISCIHSAEFTREFPVISLRIASCVGISRSGIPSAVVKTVRMIAISSFLS
jgi:hypothetical protein